MAKKISQKDHELAKKALSAYERFTGERTSHLADAFEVAEPEEDARARQLKEQQAYEQQAQLNAKVEAAHQAERLARVNADLQPGNPGPGMTALVTERARELGITGAGQEPAAAKQPSK